MGVRIRKGYVEARIHYKGQDLFQYFGKDLPEARKQAKAWVLDKKRQITLNKLDAEEGERIKWPAACDLYYKLHVEQNPNRSVKAKKSEFYQIEVVKRAWPNKFLDEITYLDVLAVRGNYDVVSTANRYNATVTGLFNKFEMWNELGNVIRKVKLPRRNPGQLAEMQLKLTGNRLSEEHLKRRRVPSKEELQAAKKWCLEHDSELWEGIKQAIITTQRKQDLINLQGKEKVEMVQGKTGKFISLPLSFPHPVNFINFRKRWEGLRVAMGWEKKGTPTHTTWHDLRHCGPTILAGLGYSSRVIKEITGHTTEKQAERYINPPADFIKPAMKDLQREIEGL